jgi:hypothetical protein
MKTVSRPAAKAQAPKYLRPEQRRDRLSSAAARYMRGDITVEEYERLEDLYLPDYREVALSLAKAKAASEKGRTETRLHTRTPHQVVRERRWRFLPFFSVRRRMA